MAGFPVGAVVGGLSAGGLVDLARSRPRTCSSRRRSPRRASPRSCGRPVGASLSSWRRPRQARTERRTRCRLSPMTRPGRRSGACSATPFRRPDPRLPGAVGSRQPARRLPRVRPGGGAVPGRRRTSPRFLAGYTAVMNVVSIAFLFLLAGPLLRRFGLRLGIAANPLVLTVFALAMIVGRSWPAAPPRSRCSGRVSAARIADIALTDGTTRTSINATYQVLPERDRARRPGRRRGHRRPGRDRHLGRADPRAQRAAVGPCRDDHRDDDHLRDLVGRGRAPVARIRPRPRRRLRRRRWLDVDAALEATDEDAALAHGLLASPIRGRCASGSSCWVGWIALRQAPTSGCSPTTPARMCG